MCPHTIVYCCMCPHATALLLQLLILRDTAATTRRGAQQMLDRILGRYSLANLLSTHPPLKSNLVLNLLALLVLNLLALLVGTQFTCFSRRYSIYLPYSFSIVLNLLALLLNWYRLSHPYADVC